MSSISIKGILLGALAGIGVSIALVLLSIPIFLWKSDEISAEPSMLESVAWHVGNVVTLLIGGYVAARIAKRGELINGALSTFLYVGGSIYFLIDPQFANEWTENLVLILTAPPLGLLGGYIYRQTFKAPHQHNA